MPTEIILGKIESVRFGHGGYQEAMIGLHITFSGKGWCVSYTKSAWDSELIKHSDHCKWSEDDRSRQYDEIMRYVSKVLSDAKVSSVDKLKDIPVEVSLENNTIKDWRVLTEVL